jgi:hypothetical protein
MQGINTENTESTEITESVLALRCVDAGESSVTLRAREFASEVRNGSDVLMYAPAGVHTITPAAGNGSIEITVAVDQNTAAVLNASLAAMNARLFPQRCFIDKEHEGKEATAWPENFFWSETAPDGSHAPGVYLKCQMTALGRQLIDGKIFRAFSPSITTDTGLKNKDIRPGQHLTIKAGKRGSKENPARLNGVAPPDIGTLTNLPAFKDILPLFAKNARGGQSNQPAAGAVLPGLGRETGKANMKKTDQELLTLRARKAELEKEIPTLRAKDLNDVENVNAVNSAQGELESIDAELRAHEVAVENEALRGELKTQREKDADASIKAAVKRGAIAPKNLELQASWKKRLVEDPTNLVLLEAIASAPALQGSQRIIINSSGAQEIRASNRDVLRRYLALSYDEKKNKEAAALYASEIRARLLEGDDIPLQAADVTDANLGTLAGTLVAQRVLDLYRLEFDGVLGKISTDFSDEPAQFESVTKTRIVIVPAVEDYSEVNGWVQNTEAKTTDVDVPLDKHRGVPIRFNTNMLARTARQLFNEQAPAASYALAKNIIDALYANITKANYADYAGNANLGGNAYLAVPEVDFGRRAFGIAGRVFNPAGVPMQNRFALLNSDYADALEQDPTITNLAVQQSSREGIITQGNSAMPPVKKFQPIEAPNLPTANNITGFFGHKSSLVVKARVPNDYTAILPGGATHGLVRLVTDPDTGFTVMVVWYADHKLGTANFRIATMFGTAKGYTKGGLVLASQ